MGISFSKESFRKFFAGVIAKSVENLFSILNVHGDELICSFRSKNQSRSGFSYSPRDIIMI
jgi:hypothetical protein